MPLSGVLFQLCEGLGEFVGVFVKFLVQLTVDGADFRVGDAVTFALGVEDWVDVEA